MGFSGRGNRVCRLNLPRGNGLTGYRLPPTEAPSISPLARPVTELVGVGPTRAALLGALEVRTLGDLLEYFPRDYRSESEELPISRIGPGDDVHMARGEVVAVNFTPSYPKPRFEATLNDGSAQAGASSGSTPATSASRSAPASCCGFRAR